MQDRFDPWLEKVPWRRKWQAISVSLPGKSHRQGGDWWATVGLNLQAEQKFTEVFLTKRRDKKIFCSYLDMNK